MKHKIELTKEYSPTINRIMLRIYLDGSFITSYYEEDMSKAMNHIAELEKGLKLEKGVLHTVEL